MSKLNAIRKQLNEQFAERSQLVDGMLTALIAKEMLFVLGNPGTAKSAICEALCKAIGGNYFSWLISKFTTPEEIFGPISLKGLEQDKYERVTTNKLPEADIAFLDEIFKGSSAILNTLLPVINERKFYDGSAPKKIQLQTLFGAANEIPDAQELAALYDRFALKYIVHRLQGNDAAKILFDGRLGQITETITIKELEAEQEAAQKLPLSKEIVDMLLKIRNEIDKEGIYVSDRKWVQATRIVKAFAHLSGHAKVELEDLTILEDVLWSTPEQYKIVKRLVNKHANPLGDQLVQINDFLTDIKTKIAEMDTQKCVEAQKKVNDAIKRMNKLGDPATNAQLAKTIQLANEINKIILVDKLGLDR